MDALSLLPLLFLLSSISFSHQRVLLNPNDTQPDKLSLPLHRLPLRPTLSLSASQDSKIAYKSPFKYSMGLVLSLPVGTPPQAQQMVLDTGSQLSWIQCQKKKQSSAFDPSLSSTFSNLPCNTSLCQPPVPDFTLPTDCDPDRLCHYSYFYADGTLAEGNLVRERIALSRSETTAPLILGCARGSPPAEGILGMNLGRLSFAFQAGVTKFSYCVPTAGTGMFYLGENPNLTGGVAGYANLLRFDKQSGSNGPLPYLDRAAYSVGMLAVRLGGAPLDIPAAAFRPDAGGAGQTILDSGTEYTFFVEDAYAKVKAAIEKAVGRRFAAKRGYVYAGGLDICYAARAADIGRAAGALGLEFEGGAALMAEGPRAWVDAGSGAACFSVGSSQLLGVESNIIGNFHQQNYWLEFDLLNSRVGMSKADCSRSA